MRYLVAIPCMDMIHVDFFRSVLGMTKLEGTRFSMTMSSLIYDARNSLAKQAITEGYDRVLWLDSDMVFDADLMERLAADMDKGHDLVAGLYFKRKAPLAPVIYADMGHMEVEGGGYKPYALPMEDYPPDQIVPIKGCGFGVCMTSVELIKRVVERFGLPFSPILGFGEDLSFCARAGELGANMVCDTAIKAGHIGYGAITEDAYKAQQEALKNGNA